MDSNVRTEINVKMEIKSFQNLLKRCMDTRNFSLSLLIRKCKGDKKFADIYALITVDSDEKEFFAKKQITTLL